MSQKATGAVGEPPTYSPERDMPTLEFDGVAYIDAVNAEHVHVLVDPFPGCDFCGPLKSTYLLPTCRCGLTLEGECPDCEPAPEAVDVFANPLVLDLRGRKAA